MKVEAVEWNPTQKRTQYNESATCKELKAMQVGECKRFEHGDIMCTHGTKEKHPNFTLINKICLLRKRGWQLECYHEAQYVAVIRRLA